MSLVSVCMEVSVFNRLCASWVWVYLGFEVYHWLNCVSGTDLCESEMCYVRVEYVHRARCNITTAQSTGVYVTRNPVVGLCVNVVCGGVENREQQSTCSETGGHTLPPPSMCVCVSFFSVCPGSRVWTTTHVLETSPLHWRTGSTPVTMHLFYWDGGRIQQQTRPLLWTLSWASLASLALTASLPLHPRVSSGGSVGEGLPAKADLRRAWNLAGLGA